MVNTNSNVSKDATILSISKGLSMAIAMISAMLLSRFRTLDEYGTYSQIITVINLTTAILMLGLPNSMNYFIARAKDGNERDRFLSLYYNLITILCVIVGLLLYLVLPVIIWYYNNSMISDFRFVLFILPWTQIIIGGLNNMLIVSGKTIKVLGFNLLRGLMLLFIIFCVQLLHQSFFFYMVCYIVVESIFSIWVYIEAKRLTTKWFFNIDICLIKKVLSFSIPMGLASAISTLNVQLDHLMVGRVFSTEELAIFSNAAKELPFTIISSAFSAVLVPKMAKLFKKNENKLAIEIWKRTIELNAIILFFCATTCFVFAPQIMTLLYSQKYIIGVSVFRIYALALLMRITYWGMILNSKGKSKLIFYSSIISLLLNLLLNYLGIALFGMNGAAIATFLVLAIMAYTQLAFSAHIVGVKIKKIFPWKRLLRIGLLNSLWGVIAYYLLRLCKIGVGIEDIIKAIIIGCMFVCIYFLILRRRLISLYKQIGSY